MIVNHRLFFVLSLVIGWVGCVPYIRAMVRGETKPHMFSWLIWNISNWICCAVQFAEGGGIGSWYMVSNGFYCLGVTVASFWIGTRDVKRIDWLVLGAALSAVPLWWLTKNPLLSIVLITVIDALGYVPMVRKSWTKPYEENIVSWAVSCVVFTCSILALENLTVANCLYPATFVAVNFGFSVFLLFRRRVVSGIAS